MYEGEEDLRRALVREHEIIEAVLHDEIAVLHERIAQQRAELAVLARMYARSEARRGAGEILRQARQSAPSGRRAMGLARRIAASPYFDEAFYKAEIAHLDRTWFPALHYVRTGSFDGRDPGPDFSTVDYYLANPDVATDGWPALAHYVLYGEAEGRHLHP